MAATPLVFNSFALICDITASVVCNFKRH
jgi:hypothetical protein